MSWDIAAWDWAGFIKTAVGAGFGTAAITGVLSWLHERRSRKEKAAFLAHRIAIEFESFGSQCAAVVNDNDNFNISTRQAGIAATRIPTIPSIPDDSDEGWHYLQPKLAERARTFSHRVSEKDREISVMWDVGELSGYDMGDAYSEASAEVGLVALHLARELRIKYNRPAPSIPDLDFLTKRVHEIERRREEYKEKLQKYWIEREAQAQKNETGGGASD